MELMWCYLLGLLVVLISWYCYHRKLPPGPWNLPILGYLPWLDALHPYITLTNLSDKYGPIYGLYLGSVYTVVISDVKLIKKVFNKDSASGRAPLHLTHGIMKGYGLICAEGALWKDQRKFVHNTLRSMGASRIGSNRINMQHLITENVLDLVQFLKNHNKKALDPLEPLRHSLGSTVNKIVFGRSWSRGNELWKWLQHLQEEGTKCIGVAGPLNFLPFLRFLPRFKKTLEFLIDGKLKTHQIYKDIISQELSVKKEAISNFIQAFDYEKNKRDPEEQERFYNDEQFCHLLADIFGASLDTTLATLRWYLLYLAINDDIQDKIRQYLVDIIGDKLPTFDDLPFLPYVEASIAEIQRIRSVVPVGIPHGTMDELNINEYTIPKNSMIIPLQWAIHMNPNIWENPQCFMPERFINHEGKFTKPEFFMPFQTGKRMCVGDELARMLLFLYGSILIKKFRISCVNIDSIDLVGDCGITLTPKPHQLIFASL